MSTKQSAISPELRAMLDDFVARRGKPKTVAAEGKAEEAVAVVPLEGEDLERVKGALAGRYARINGDEVGFDKVTHARVTMRWCRPTAAYEGPRVVSNYNPFSLERLPGYDPDDK